MLTLKPSLWAYLTSWPWKVLNAACRVPVPLSTGANVVPDSVSASVMNGGQSTGAAVLPAAAKATYGWEVPETGTVMFVKDGLSSSGL